ncbi:MAG: ABC transporter ATP-binding protein [Eubacteriaceae bacterium]|nr:ABC transporter ATP-binding protein [Eubacteriaceae bacterium]
MQPEFDAQLAEAKKQAEAAAKSAVDAAFAANQPKINAQIASAKKTAEKAAIDAVNKAFMDEEGMTKEQLDAFLLLAAMPSIKSTNDYNERADIAQTFFDVMQSLPSSMIADNESIKSSNLKLDNLSDENLTKYINDIRQTGGNIPFDKMARILLFLLCIYAVSSVFTAAMQYIMSSVAQKVVYNMRKDVNEKLTRLPLKYFDSHANGDIISRMTNDMDTISTTLQQSLTQFIQAILQIIGYIIMMLTISPILTLIVMLTLPLYIIVTTLIAKKSQKFYAAQQKHLGDLSGHTEEMYTGHMIIKAFGQEENSIEIFESANDKLYNAGWKAQFFSGVMFPLMNFISNFGYVLISVVGGIFVTKTWLNIGDITAFIQYSRQFTMPIIQTANIANIIQSTVACSERVFEILDEEEELADSKDAKIIKYPHGDIVFDHVKFSYKESEPLIEDMNLNIKKGETIAIVGPTGAGKTTLVNLLMRFYEINGGSITFDGIDIRDIKRGNLRTMFGMVLQDTWLFNGTLEQNILYGRQDATSEEVVSAAKAAHADHFIRSLPEGYKTVLNEEASNISQGQKQLLTIARAILANPSVLILDEATSSVDTRTEVLIQKAMGKLMEGRTNFVIAHRLSTIRDAKLILVMNRGSIIESGTHQELLDKKGFYYELYNSQFAAPSIG